MARALTAPGPLDTLEEAFDLLQRASAAVWLRYLAGAGPLIVGLLYAWNEFSDPGPGDNPVIAALFLVAILVWFYHCRQIFSGQLRRILSLAPANAKPPRPAWSVACFEGTKLVALPIAVASILPIAFATAFYRILSLSAGEGLSAREACVKAWRTGPAWQRENWFGLAIINLLALVVFVDVALTVIITPLLVKIFTGYESVFTQRGTAAMAIQFPVIVALTWLCLDPLLQAVYVVRAFKWDGQLTGEDLLVRLKRLAPLLVMIAIGVAGSGLYAEPALTRDTLNQSIDQTLQSHAYDWRNPPPASAGDKKDWFLDTVDRVVALLQKTWKVIRDLFSDVVDWIDRLLRPFMPEPGKTGSGKPAGVRSAFYGIGIAILALLLVLLWKFGPRRRAILPAPVAAGNVDLNNEGLLASDLPEEEWLRMADGYAASGDLRLSLRALYLGTLALLHRRGLLTIHACKSNRDYEREVRRRSRDNALSQIFRLNVRSFEKSWYGFHEVTGAQIQDFRDSLGQIRSKEAAT